MNHVMSLTYVDGHAAIDFLERAFGYRRRLVVPTPEGGVLHSELSLGDGVIFVSEERAGDVRRSPKTLGATCSSLCVAVEDPDAHCERARAAGALILQEPEDTNFGARGYLAADLEGHNWFFSNYTPGEFWDDVPCQAQK